MDKNTYEQMTEVGRRNLAHVIEDACTDPDCEIHHPEVGVQEETVDLTDLAFFIAGYFAGAKALEGRYDGLKQDLLDELNDSIFPRPQEGK